MVSPVDINTVTGLSEQDAIARLKQEGYNELPSAGSRNLFLIAWEIIQDPIFLSLSRRRSRTCGCHCAFLLKPLHR